MFLCAGFETETVKNWKSLAPAPKAPSNYKNPDVIEKYVQEATAKLNAEAPDMLFLGQVRRAFVCDACGEPIIDGNAKAFYDLVTAKMRNDPDLILFGLDIRRRLRQLWVHVSCDGADAGPLMPALWPYSPTDRNRIVDVAEAVGAAKDALLNYVVTTVPYALRADATGEASLVRTIVRRFRLDLMGQYGRGAAPSIT